MQKTNNLNNLSVIFFLGYIITIVVCLTETIFLESDIQMIISLIIGIISITGLHYKSGNTNSYIKNLLTSHFIYLLPLIFLINFKLYEVSYITKELSDILFNIFLILTVIATLFYNIIVKQLNKKYIR